jgi:hypothetical protein
MESHTKAFNDTTINKFLQILPMGEDIPITNPYLLPHANLPLVKT